MKVLLLSADVIANSLIESGDALEAFIKWKPRSGETVFGYRKGDIYITAAHGSVYLMSKRETKLRKIAFTPVPATEIANMVHAMKDATA